MPGLIFFNRIKILVVFVPPYFSHILHDDILFLSKMPPRPLNLVLINMGQHDLCLLIYQQTKCLVILWFQHRHHFRVCL